MQTWYLLLICSNLATLVNPFFRPVISVTEDARGSHYFITMVYNDPSKHQKQFSSTVTPIGVILANRKKQKFIYLFILATCPANGDGDGDDTVKSNFLVMIFYAAFGNTLTALLRQAKIF